MKVIGIIAAGVALFIGGAVAASAAETTATPPATTTTQTPPPATGDQTPATGQETPAATQPDPNEKICKKDQTTGTRISKVCKTRKEWEEDAKNTNDF